MDTNIMLFDDGHKAVISYDPVCLFVPCQQVVRRCRSPVPAEIIHDALKAVVDVLPYELVTPPEPREAVKEKIWEILEAIRK